jgi:hypothetical protein
MEQTKVESKPLENSKGSKTEHIMREFPDNKAAKSKSKDMLFAWVFFAVLAGIATGWLFSGKKAIEAQKVSETGAVVSTDTKAEVGVLNNSVNYSEAEGKLVEGGIQGEGTHHLERDGGPSQNAYLTSTVIDLQSYVGKKVHVWGETNSAQKGGWLMDVAKIKVLD